MKKMKTLLIITIIVLIVAAVMNFTKMVMEADTQEVEPIINAGEYSRISYENLIDKLGEPDVIEPTGSTAMLEYDINNLHYDFTLYEGNIVKLTIYSEKSWSGTGEKFSFGDPENIPLLVGVDPVKGAKVTESVFNYSILQPSDNIASITTYDKEKPDGLCGYITITYDTRYQE